MSGVSQETTPSRGIKYRQQRAARTRERMIDAIIAHAGEGNYRVSVRQVCQYAQVSRESVIDHFGSLGLLCRVVARERWQDVPLPPSALIDVERKALVWALLVGVPRDV